jgi:hypothetical protein
MTDRIYRLFFGAAMLIALYFDFKYAIYALIAIMTFEGITGWRITKLVYKLRGIKSYADANTQSNCKFNVEAERMWRLLIGGIFILSCVIYPEPLWYVPWFLAFVIFGAGASDVCPGLVAMKKAGFK